MIAIMGGDSQILATQTSIFLSEVKFISYRINLSTGSIFQVEKIIYLRPKIHSYNTQNFIINILSVV